ncbi:MAG: AmpG permease, partial [Bacteroidota bacterium]
MNSKQTPWYWVPSLYFFQGIPYSVVMVTSGLIYTTMGISVSSFTFWTSLLYLPWTIKPLWSPFVDFASTKRNWVVKTQILLGIAFLLAGFSMPTSYFYPLSLLLLGLIALCSATHDIAADGFYMLALNTHQQSFFVGIRSTFYRVAMLTALGGLPLLAGFIQSSTGLEPKEFTVAALERQTDKYSLPEVLPQPDKASQPQIVLAATKPAIYLDTQVDSAVVLVSLSKSPDSDKPYTLQIAQTSGSKDLSLPKSQSLVLQFNAENWNTPQSVTIKADPNMRSAAQAVFTITAGNIAFSWLVALGSLGVLLLVFATFHQFVLPRPATEKTVQHYDTKAYFSVFVSFFKKKQVLASVLFFLFYRLGEAQLVKIATPFLVDSRANGGIGLSSAEYGFAYGTLGMISLTLGGILGGLGAARYGLKR